jgi:putative transcriptional regulator
MTTLRGQLLISGGNLYDPSFRHTVVLVGEHNEAGALGVILNRPLDVTVALAVPPLAELVPPGEALFEGGPVNPPQPVLLADFHDPSEAHLPVFGSIGFLIGEVPREAARGLRRARIFAGYAGWDAGQLEAELEEEAWIVEPARPEDVFTDDPESLWTRVLRRKGPEFDLLSRMPYDPTMN